MADLDRDPDRDPRLDLALRLVSPSRGEAFIRFMDDVAERRRRRASRMFNEAADTAGMSADDLFDEIADDERLADMFADAVDAAGRSTWEARITMLGKALAAAVRANDDAQVDEAELIARAVAALEPVHARALWLIGKVGRTNPTAFGGFPGLIAKVFPQMAPVAGQVAAVLLAHGLVVDPFYVNGVLELTPFGKDILGRFVDAGGLDGTEGVLE